MEDDKKVRRIIIQAYKDQIINGITDLRIILFKNDELFVEVNPNTYAIRPLNSIFWKTVDENEYHNIFNYLKYHYHNLTNFIQDDIADIGTLQNNIFAIDIDSFDTFISNSKFFNIDRVYLEYRKLLEFSNKLYNQWYSIMNTYLDTLIEDGE